MNVPPRFIVTQSTRTSRISGVAAVLVVIALAAAPLWLSRNGIRLAGEMLVYIGLASLWNLLAGYGGLVSIGQQAYVGLGAYLLFAASMMLGVPPLLAVPLVGVAAAICALPVSALLFRLREAYFAIGAWVVAEVFRLGAAQTSLLGGGSGVSLPIDIVKSIGATREAREIVIFDATLATTLAILALLFLITRSQWGLALQAIRDNEAAAESSGVDVTRFKRLIYVAAAVGAAMLGAVIGLAKLRISPDSMFSVNDWTAFVIFITVIGGVGRIEGPIFGTILFFILRETLSDLGPFYLIALGAIGVATMLLAPKGIFGLIAERHHIQLFPIARRVTWLTRQDQPSRDAQFDRA
jgi:branched-chain amino acid transport system permease protein